MPARDPAERAEIAAHASNTHLARLDAAGRRRMTAPARAARLAREITQVRAEAAAAGEFIDDDEAERRASYLRRASLAAASRKGVEARRRRARERAGLIALLAEFVEPGKLQTALDNIAASVVDAS
jgi:hypothetical protein